MNDMNIKGHFRVQHLDKDGNLKGDYDFPNGIVDVGLNHILDTQFHADTPVGTWYLGLVDNSGWTAFANADTMASHTGWSESVVYSEGTRGEWTEDAASSRSITNSTTVDFSINGTVTLKGIFVCSDGVKSATTGVLWSTAAFASLVSAVNGDTLKITYTVSG